MQPGIKTPLTALNVQHEIYKSLNEESTGQDNEYHKKGGQRPL